MSKKTDELRKQLMSSKRCCHDRVGREEREKVFAFAEEYKKYLSAGRIERSCVAETVTMAEAEGFRPLGSDEKLKAGDRVYRVNRDRSLMLAVIGKKPLSEGFSLVAAHVDSPRLDLKAVPFYEDGGLCLMKTHYYGGVKKYQWTAIPLMLEGVVVRADGERIPVCIGRDPGDPVFSVTDLLPHLGKEQMKKTLAEGVDGESLNILAGTLPADGEETESDRIKLAVLSLLNEKYGVSEEDFLSAELAAVPAFEVRDVGFDRSLIGGYGHDDRVCAYPAVRAVFEQKNPEYTAVCLLADKEEIGSDGVTGMQSQAFEWFIEDIGGGCSLRRCFAASVCLSADVCNAFDPTYASVSEKRNSALCGYGLGVMKYTGRGGKAETSDATAELMGEIRGLFDRAGVVWQTTELGAVDAGGGGTVAKYLARRNISVLDAGVPVLSMHAPFEVISKYDLYQAYKAFNAFYRR